MTTQPIGAGEPFANPRGQLVAAPHAGLLVVELGEVIPEERMAAVLNELGGWRVKRRKGEE